MIRAYILNNVIVLEDFTSIYLPQFNFVFSYIIGQYEIQFPCTNKS